MYYRYYGKTLQLQDLKNHQLVIKLSIVDGKVKIQNPRTNKVQYVSEELFNKYFKLSSEKYYL